MLLPQRYVFPHNRSDLASCMRASSRGRQRNITIVIVATLCIAFVLAGPSKSWAKRSSQLQELSFSLYSNHFVVATGSLGDLDKRNVLIDTGTNLTMIDGATAEELRLRRTETAASQISVVEGVVECYEALLGKLDFGPVHLQSVPVAVTNLSWVRQQTGIRVDAVIGLDVLRQANFQIDYESRKITFGSSRPPRSTVPVAEVGRYLVVDAQLDRRPLKLLLDTGSASLVLFADHLPESLAAASLSSTATISDLAGPLTLKKLNFKEVKLGRTNIGAAIAVLAKAESDCPFQGILGISATRFKRVSFDMEKRRVGFELKEQIAPSLAAHLLDDSSENRPRRWHR